MRYLFWFFGILILGLIQMALYPFHLFPMNLFLVLLVVSLLFAGFDFSLGLAVILGFVLDFLSGTTDGTIVLTFVTVFLCMYFIINFILAREPSLPILFFSVAGATAAYFVLLAGFNFLFGLIHLGSIVNYSSFFLNDFPKTLFFNLLFAYPVLKYFVFIEYLPQIFHKHDSQPIRT